MKTKQATNLRAVPAKTEEKPNDRSVDRLVTAVREIDALMVSEVRDHFEVHHRLGGDVRHESTLTMRLNDLVNIRGLVTDVARDLGGFDVAERIVCARKAVSK